MKPTHEPKRNKRAGLNKKPTQQEDYTRQLPPHVDKAAERGERVVTGKTIAHGGHPDKK